MIDQSVSTITVVPRVVNRVLQTLIKHITHFWSAPEWVICFIIDWSHLDVFNNK